MASTSVSRGLFLAAVRPAGGLAVASPGKASPPRRRDPGAGAILLTSPYPGPQALTRGTWLPKQPEPIENRRLVFSSSLTSYWSSTRTRACNHSCRNLIAPMFFSRPGLRDPAQADFARRGSRNPVRVH